MEKRPSRGMHVDDSWVSLFEELGSFAKGNLPWFFVFFQLSYK